MLLFIPPRSQPADTSPLATARKCALLPAADRLQNMPATTPPPPRRNWHLARWFLVLVIATFGWSGWQAYAYRAAISQARKQGWWLEYRDPVKTIRTNWKAAFEKETWMDGVTEVYVSTSEEFEKHLTMAHRLNPMNLRIEDAATSHDLSAFSRLARLRGLMLENATGLTDVGALKNLESLELLNLVGSTRLTNVDGLKNLPALKYVCLNGSTGLTNVEGFKSCPSLKVVLLDGCTGLTNVDVLKRCPELETVSLKGCTGLTNLDVLKNLPALRRVYLEGCAGLTPESVAALKAALPNTQITGP